MFSKRGPDGNQHTHGHQDDIQRLFATMVEHNRWRAYILQAWALRYRCHYMIFHRCGVWQKGLPYFMKEIWPTPLFGSIYTEMKLTFVRNFHHCLHWKMLKWQLPVQPMTKILSKWHHFGFSACVFSHLLEESDTKAADQEHPIMLDPGVGEATRTDGQHTAHDDVTTSITVRQRRHDDGTDEDTDNEDSLRRTGQVAAVTHRVKLKGRAMTT